MCGEELVGLINGSGPGLILLISGQWTQFHASSSHIARHYPPSTIPSHTDNQIQSTLCLTVKHTIQHNSSADFYVLRSILCIYFSTKKSKHILHFFSDDDLIPHVS